MPAGRFRVPEPRVERRERGDPRLSLLRDISAL